MQAVISSSSVPINLSRHLQLEKRWGFGVTFSILCDRSISGSQAEKRQVRRKRGVQDRHLEINIQSQLFLPRSGLRWAIV